MNHPVRVQVIRVWLVCKLCRDSFPDVTSFLAHKTEKHFDEFKTVKSIIFEERIVRNDLDIDSKATELNPRQIEPEKSLEEPRDRQAYTCKFTNANQKNAVDFTIEDEYVTINISRLNPNLAQSESGEQAKSEEVDVDVDDEFLYGDEIEILESDQGFHQPEENSEKLLLAALSEPPKIIYQHFDAETEDISHEDTLTSNGSNFHNGPNINLKCLQNPYVLLERLTIKGLVLATGTGIEDQQKKCQNLNSISEDSDSTIETDTKTADPVFDPSHADTDSNSNSKLKSLETKLSQNTLVTTRLQDNLSVEKSRVCSVCDLSFRYQGQLNDHKWKTHSMRPVSCTYPNCNLTVMDRNSLNRHLKRHEKPSSTIRYVFPRHLDKEGVKTDEDCLPLSEWLKNQLQTDNVIILEPDPLITENLGAISLTNPITCKLCSKSLTSETQVKIHVKNCWTHNVKMHRFCIPCKISFDHPHILKLHNMKVHLTQEEKDVQYPFKCDHCSRKFIYHYELKYHQETHKRSEERMNVVDCHICGKPGVHKSYLEDHLRTHSADKSCICPHSECSKAYKTILNLKDHLKRVHSDSRPFQCPQGSYSGKTKVALKRHSFVHKKELEKPLQYFRCAHGNCDKQYLALNTLKYHMKKYHNIYL